MANSFTVRTPSPIETQDVLIDDAIDATITRTAEVFGGVRLTAAVAHLEEELNDQPFTSRR